MIHGVKKAAKKVSPNIAASEDENAMVPIINEPKDVVVIVAGGVGGKLMWRPIAGAQSLSVGKVIERSA